MTKIIDLHKQWIKDVEYKQEYSKLEAEFNHAKAVMLEKGEGEEAEKRAKKSMREGMKKSKENKD